MSKNFCLHPRIPDPKTSNHKGKNNEDVQITNLQALSANILNLKIKRTVFFGGGYRIRTVDPLRARQVL